MSDLHHGLHLLHPYVRTFRLILYDFDGRSRRHGVHGRVKDRKDQVLKHLICSQVDDNESHLLSRVTVNWPAVTLEFRVVSQLIFQTREGSGLCLQKPAIAATVADL